jgi:hypothetical protein
VRQANWYYHEKYVLRSRQAAAWVAMCELFDPAEDGANHPPSVFVDVRASDLTPAQAQRVGEALVRAAELCEQWTRHQAAGSVA